MKHKLTGIAILGLSALLCTGCTSISDAPPIEPIVTTPQKEDFPNSDAVMVEYIMDWSEPRKGLPNVLLKSHYTVKYDGTVDAYSEYADGTILNINVRKLSNKQVQAFYNMLTSSPIKEKEDASGPNATYTINLLEADGSIKVAFTGALTEEYQTEIEKYLFDVIYGEENVLLEVSFREVAPTPDRDDVWESSNWQVFNDGTVKYYDMYKGGPSETQQWTLTDKEIKDLQSMFVNEIPTENMVPCDIPLYDIKYYNQDTTVKFDFWGTPGSQFFNNLMEILDKNDKNMNQNETLLTQITAQNWGLMSVDADSWMSTTWEIYSDGTVNQIVKYRQSKEQIETWVLDEEKLTNAYNFFVDNKKTNPVQACDGTGYDITVFEIDGTMMYHFTGYIYGTPFEQFERYIAQ